MSVKKRGLGRGLDALLGSASPSTETDSGDALQELPLGQLVAGKHQPRRHFDEAALAELTASIKAQGVVQPIIARQLSVDHYEIVAGERRWRAATAAGLSTIPVVIRQLDERSAMAIALVENIQRADLNALEEAEALKKLIDECGLTHEACAEAVGKSRAAVSNLLRLMDLEPDVQTRLRLGLITFGHAKVLLSVSGKLQSQLAHEVSEQQLSVRQTEQLIAGKKQATGIVAKARGLLPVEAELIQRWGHGVKLRQNDKGAGTLTVAFRSNTELNQLLAVLREGAK